MKGKTVNWWGKGNARKRKEMCCKARFKLKRVSYPGRRRVRTPEKGKRCF